jgi:hypothetical protein
MGQEKKEKLVVGNIETPPSHNNTDTFLNVKTQKLSYNFTVFIYNLLHATRE